MKLWARNQGGAAVLFDGLFNVRQYGAAGDGIADDTAAINRAIASVGRDGGVLYFPAGTYLISSGINCTGSASFDVAGAGYGTSIIKSNFATGDVFTYNVLNGSVRNIGFDSSVIRTSGATIRLIPNGATVESVRINKPYIGLENTGQINQLIDLSIYNITPRSASANSGGIYNHSSGIMRCIGCTSSGLGSGIIPANADFPEYGYRNEGEELDLIGCFAFICNKGRWDISAPGKIVIGANVGCWFDSMLAYGALADSTAGGQCFSVNFTGCWFAPGFNSAPITAGVEYLGPGTIRCQITGSIILAYNNGSGFGIGLTGTGSTRDVTLTGNIIGLAAFGFAQGVFAADGMENWMLSGGQVVANTIGVLIGSSNDHFGVCGVVFNGNGTNIINSSAGSTNVSILGNPGVDTFNTASIVYTPTLSSLIGALGAGNSASASYFKIGKMVYVNVSVTIGAAGAGTAAFVTATLPFTAAAHAVILNGKNTAVGYQMLGDIASSGSVVRIHKYDGAGAVANNDVYVVDGWYEAA